MVDVVHDQAHVTVAVRQLARAFPHLDFQGAVHVLQAFVRILQFRRHVVEGATEDFQLVTAGNVDPNVALAGSQGVHRLGQIGHRLGDVGGGLSAAQRTHDYSHRAEHEQQSHREQEGASGVGTGLTQGLLQRTVRHAVVDPAQSVALVVDHGHRKFKDVLP